MTEATAPSGCEVWRERVVYSECCDTPHRADYATGCADQPCATCDQPTTFRDADPKVDETPLGWWYWWCAPGCLPDSEDMGPFNSEAEAVEDTRDFAGEYDFPAVAGG